MIKATVVSEFRKGGVLHKVGDIIECDEKELKSLLSYNYVVDGVIKKAPEKPEVNKMIDGKTSQKK